MIAFFAAGAAVAARLALVLIGRWRRKTSESVPQLQWQKTAQPREPSLAELLAETGWRINPDELQRAFARKAIPLILIAMVAILFLIAHSNAGWLLLGSLAGWASANSLLAFIQQ
jgi:hypothetical protein